MRTGCLEPQVAGVRCSRDAELGWGRGGGGRCTRALPAHAHAPTTASAMQRGGAHARRAITIVNHEGKQASSHELSGRSHRVGGREDGCGASEIDQRGKQRTRQLLPTSSLSTRYIDNSHTSSLPVTHIQATTDLQSGTRASLCPASFDPPSTGTCTAMLPRRRSGTTTSR